jgi:hypothetical protein
MRNESLGQLLFDSQHIGRFIDVFLATHIASDAERSVDRRARGNGVGLGEKDFVLIDKVARNVVDVIFASHDPAVGNILPHIVLPIRTTVGWQVGWEPDDGRNSNPARLDSK